MSTVEKSTHGYLNRNEYCQLECKREYGQKSKRNNPAAGLCYDECIALLAENRQSLSEGRGPFHRHDERFGNMTMYVP